MIKNSLFFVFLLLLFSLLISKTYASEVEECQTSLSKGDYETSLLLCTQAVNKAKGNYSQVNLVTAYFHLFELHYQKGDSEKIDYYLTQIKSLAIFDERIDFQYQWNRYKGKHYFRIDNYKEAKAYFSKALKIAESEDNQQWKSISYNDVALAELRLNNYKVSLKFFYLSLNLKKQIDNLFSIAKTQTNIGLNQTKLEEYDKALSYYQQAHANYLKYAALNPENKKVYYSIVHLYEYYSDCYVLMGDTEKASEFLPYILTSIASNLSPRKQSMALVSIAKIFNQQSKHKQAITLLDRALVLQVNNDFNHIAAINYQLAVAYHNTKQLNAAILSAEAGLRQSKESNSLLMMSKYHNLLGTLYRQTNKDKAIFHIESYQKSREIFLKKKYDADVKTIQHKLETKNLQWDLTHKELENQKNRVKIQTLTNWSLVFVVLLLASLLITALLYLKRKRERAILIQSIHYHQQQLLLLSSATDSTGNDNLLTTDSTQLKEVFRQLLVEIMIDCLKVWEGHTRSNRVELAERSKIWTVSIDEGTLRTRSLDKYLSLKKLPKNPKWRNVVKTCHYILSDSSLSPDYRAQLNSKLESLMDLVKQLSLQK